MPLKRRHASLESRENDGDTARPVADQAIRGRRFFQAGGFFASAVSSRRRFSSGRQSIQ
jgi:hypothetical protein